MKLKERNHLENAYCKNIVDRCAGDKENSDPIEGKIFLSSGTTLVPLRLSPFMDVARSICCFKQTILMKQIIIILRNITT